MKKIIFLTLTIVALVAMGCSQNTYSNLRNKEDKLIANYINRNGLIILNEEPTKDHVWTEKEYYKVHGHDNFYFHLIERGDTTRIDTISPAVFDTVDLKIVVNDIIVARYKQFELTENADTLSYWTTLDKAYPDEFHYGNQSECDIIAWHLAVKLMGYPDSQCEIIVPSKMGSSEAQTTVTPYIYILKIKVKQ